MTDLKLVRLESYSVPEMTAGGIVFSEERTWNSKLRGRWRVSVRGLISDAIGLCVIDVCCGRCDDSAEEGDWADEAFVAAKPPGRWAAAIVQRECVRLFDEVFAATLARSKGEPVEESKTDPEASVLIGTRPGLGVKLSYFAGLDGETFDLLRELEERRAAMATGGK